MKGRRNYEMEIKPSLAIWQYFKKDITVLQVVSAIADRCGDYHISYSANELLIDLGLVTSTGTPNKKARRLVAWYLHEKYHGSISPIILVEPKDGAV